MTIESNPTRLDEFDNAIVHRGYLDVEKEMQMQEFQKLMKIE